MEQISLRDLFSFLLSPHRFQKCQEDRGDGYREIHFHSNLLTIRILEQAEVVALGASSTCLAFLIDPENSSRWCMFEKAVGVVLEIKIAGSQSLQELATKMERYIDALLSAMREGKELPFQDFSGTA